MADEDGKMTLRRLEAPIQKFIKVVIPTDLERLHKHQYNIEKVNTHTHTVGHIMDTALSFSLNICTYTVQP